MHVSEQSKSLPPIQPPPHCPKNCSSLQLFAKLKLSKHKNYHPETNDGANRTRDFKIFVNGKR